MSVTNRQSPARTSVDTWPWALVTFQPPTSPSGVSPQMGRFGTGLPCASSTVTITGTVIVSPAVVQPGTTQLPGAPLTNVGPYWKVTNR